MQQTRKKPQLLGLLRDLGIFMKQIMICIDEAFIKMLLFLVSALFSVTEKI